MTDPIRFFLDGAEVEAEPGETIWQVANRQGYNRGHVKYKAQLLRKLAGN